MTRERAMSSLDILGEDSCPSLPKDVASAVFAAVTLRILIQRVLATKPMNQVGYFVFLWLKESSKFFSL